MDKYNFVKYCHLENSLVRHSWETFLRKHSCRTSARHSRHTLPIPNNCTLGDFKVHGALRLDSVVFLECSALKSVPYTQANIVVVQCYEKLRHSGQAHFSQNTLVRRSSETLLRSTLVKHSCNQRMPLPQEYFNKFPHYTSPHHKSKRDTATTKHPPQKQDRKHHYIYHHGPLQR